MIVITSTHCICHLDFDIDTDNIDASVQKCDLIWLSGKNRAKFGPEPNLGLNLDLRPLLGVESLYRDI